MLPELSNIEDEERNGIEIAAAALGRPQRIGQEPFYTGNQRQWKVRTLVNSPSRRADWTHIRLRYLLTRSIPVKSLSHSVKYIDVCARRRYKLPPNERRIHVAWK